jgi:hypothetical protein
VPQHVPVVSPAAIAQLPEQQSPLAVQAPPLHMQGGAHVPLVWPGGSSQTSPGQHSPLVVQDWPMAAHTGGIVQTPFSHHREQHSDHAEQLVPSGKQPRHRNVPSPSGTHGSPQHCSENWQVPPGGRHIGPHSHATPGGQGGQAHLCLSHQPEQHSEPVEHFAPVDSQVAGQ